jgi:hypothetical protein
MAERHPDRALAPRINHLASHQIATRHGEQADFARAVARECEIREVDRIVVPSQPFRRGDVLSVLPPLLGFGVPP